MDKVDFIILCGGNSKRFYGISNKKNKVNEKINDISLINIIINKIIKLKITNNIILVHNNKINIDSNSKKILYISGGKTRQESVFFGLKLIKTKFVIIHDGCRPFFNVEEINQLFKKIKNNKIIYGISCSSPQINCLKQIKNNHITTINKRNKIISVKTPQIFQTKIIIKAHNLAIENNHKNCYDDFEIIEKFITKNIKHLKFYTNYSNIKITFKKQLEEIKKRNLIT